MIRYNILYIMAEIGAFWIQEIVCVCFVCCFFLKGWGVGVAGGVIGVEL